MAKGNEKETVTKEATYTKPQILKSKQFSNYHDVLNVVLKDDENYTFEEVLQKANDFLAEPVNELVNK